MFNINKRIILNKPFLVILLALILSGLICLQPAPVHFKSGARHPYINKNDNNSNNKNNRFTVLESYITDNMKENLVPGLSIVIFKNREIIYQKGFGVKNAATGEPVKEDTIFQAASFSKTLTAYAAMILVERGRLSLNEPLNRYLKQDYLPDPQSAGLINLRMVLNHTSGLSNDSDGNDRQVYFTPGAYFSYSGAGFRYLQQVIEDVSGLPFAEFMEQEIIQPLGMNSSSFTYRKEMRSRMASGHEDGQALPIEKMEANAAYSLLSTPSDMARFYMEICHPTLLKPETVAQMLKATVQWQDDIYWGLGLGILKSSGRDYFWHWGNNDVYTNFMITGKDSKTGVIIMTNGNTGMKLAERLAVKIMNEYFLDEGKSLDSETFDLIL